MLRTLFNLVVLNVLISFSPGISMAAHFGGGNWGSGQHAHASQSLRHENCEGAVLFRRALASVGLPGRSLVFPSGRSVLGGQ